ncbi:uncharacterized protein KQ657_000295 [Scheffersomyces spartinae]|uniref:Myotubularin phosphatase domain-containing protein n=1 Tax=Scheffersomyces spartinae TaxID=45513 RepID=A0A9P7VEC5_9ASCO|nr:uncharacterized protein KQ657_000295 [Scheffersomyces spartinae]KAG7196280.1 hypothetical protein KQ657_000295 [Scheffersomyces spartinae]
MEKMHKSRGSSCYTRDHETGIDFYAVSHIRLQCKDFTYYSFDFKNDAVCTEVFNKLSSLISVPKVNKNIQLFYAFAYKRNVLEEKLPNSGWNHYNPLMEYQRQGLINDYWRASSVNEDYKFCPSYPKVFIVPSSISDSVLKHAGKFRSKMRIPVIVYKHRLGGKNGNVIARCAQPLVGLNLQNRSLQDERLILEIFKTQESERATVYYEQDLVVLNNEQPQKNLIVDLRPLTNAMAQHALGAGTENIDNYRGGNDHTTNNSTQPNASGATGGSKGSESSQSRRNVDKIFCNLDNIHVMRDSLNKLSAILNDIDKYPQQLLTTTTDTDDTSNGLNPPKLAEFQQALTKTQWLNRLSLILQSVDRITKSVHLNNTNVVIHCSDGWDRTSQVSALLQLCLDPYYRTIDGFITLIEKEWISFGFKFNTRSDHGGCIGAYLEVPQQQTPTYSNTNTGVSSSPPPGYENTAIGDTEDYSTPRQAVTSFLQRAAYHIKNTASSSMNGSHTPGMPQSTNRINENGSNTNGGSSQKPPNTIIYGGSNERSPIFHQFLDCVFQIVRQHTNQFEFNTRLLKRLFYHYYSCQYGSFLCDSELELLNNGLQDKTVSVWDYFKSRPPEFTNPGYNPVENEVLFFNFMDVRWWYELYGRTDEEMNGLSKSLEKKFAEMNVK